MEPPGESADVDIDTTGLEGSPNSEDGSVSGYTARVQVILLALKQDGMIVADNGSDFQVVRMSGVVTH